MKKKFTLPLIGLGALILFSAFRKKGMGNVGSAQEKIRKLALLYEGISEIGDNQGFTDAAFTEMMKKAGWRSSEEWCMYYAKAIYIYALPELIEDFNQSLSGSTQSSFKNVQNGKSRHLKVVTSGPVLVGDIMILQNKSNPSKGHAGIVIATDNANKKYTTIEGNVNYNPEHSGENELVDRVPHVVNYGQTDSAFSSKILRGFIRLV